jgi:hypothetical protein
MEIQAPIAVKAANREDNAITLLLARTCNIRTEKEKLLTIYKYLVNILDFQTCIDCHCASERLSFSA